MEDSQGADLRLSKHSQLCWLGWTRVSQGCLCSPRWRGGEDAFTARCCRRRSRRRRRRRRSRRRRRRRRRGRRARRPPEPDLSHSLSSQRRVWGARRPNLNFTKCQEIIWPAERYIIHILVSWHHQLKFRGKIRSIQGGPNVIDESFCLFLRIFHPSLVLPTWLYKYFLNLRVLHFCLNGFDQCNKSPGPKGAFQKLLSGFPPLLNGKPSCPKTLSRKGGNPNPP